MTHGRVAAQASHASNAFIKKYGHRSDVKQWQKQTSQGFGTAIVLSSNIDQITDTFSLAKNFPHDMVEDPEYGIKVPAEIIPMIKDYKYISYIPTDRPPLKEAILYRSEITCGYIFGTKEQLTPYLEDIPLYG
jgi:hypothetical protein